MELDVAVARMPQTNNTATWEVIFTAGDRGAWLFTYGFIFTHNTDDTYYAAPTGNNSYTIQKQDKAFSMTFVPSIFFTWLPASRANSDLSFGPTAGLGFDLSAPVVSLGASLLYNYNISLVAGGSFQQHTLLNGQYHAGQPINENLTNDQLTHKTYGPTWFAGLTFRFASNPFHAKVAEQPAPTLSPTPAPTPTPKAAGS